MTTEINNQKSIDATGNLPPEITENGRKVLQMVTECRKNAKYQYPGNVYSFLGDPIIPDFGDLNDQNTPCELVFDRYFTPETSSDGDYSEERKRILFFDKKIIIEALSKLEPEETIRVKGSGRAIHFLERAGYGYNHNENTVESDIDNEVEVTLTITFFQNGKLVVFNFDSNPIGSESKFMLRRSVSLFSNGVLSGDILV